MDVKTLTELALKKSGDTSIRAFAKRLGVSHVTVLAWLDESRYPSFEHAAHLAGLAELPIIETASNIRMQCPSNTNKDRSILKQIASATATLIVGVGVSLPNTSHASIANREGLEGLNQAGGPCWNRTSDQRIKSPMLYRLS